MYILTSKYFPTDYWPDLYFPVLPEGVDIQYTEVMEFSVVLPNDVSVSATTGMLVAGAGSTAVNGTYTEYGTYNSRTRYKKSGTPNYYILWSLSNTWFITSVGEDGSSSSAITLAALYAGVEKTLTPDLVTTWVRILNGVAPAPTVDDISSNVLTEVAPFTVEMPMVVEIETYEELSL